MKFISLLLLFATIAKGQSLPDLHPDWGHDPPTLTSPGQEAARVTIEGNKVIHSIVAAHVSDPSDWYVSPKAALISPEVVTIRPRISPAERLNVLRREKIRLAAELMADGIKVSYQALSATLSALESRNDGSPAEALRDEVVELGVNYMFVQREIEAIELSNKTAQRQYLSRLRSLNVLIPEKAEPSAAIGPNEERLWPTAEPSREKPFVEAHTSKDCTPITEETFDYVLLPKLVGSDGQGQPLYNYLWTRIDKTVVSYPDGCYK
jgi:hypothetical protein